VRDPAREATVLARLKERARGQIEGRALEAVFERIMEMSRSLEEEDARR
jgi:chorismate mutase